MQAAEKIRVGVIGAGKMGELHVRKYLELANVDFVGLYDPDGLRAKGLTEKYGVQSHSSLAELLFEIDAVSVASPTETHFAVAKQCFESGVHVLLEKPISRTAEEGETLSRPVAIPGFNLSSGFSRALPIPNANEKPSLFADSLYRERSPISKCRSRG